ncbi:MAG: ATP-dependent RecD-like DNA helicase [Oscillospiraceae bacterium]|nr:ATP-dependent RecD-like DNA helicase [Oscillospiraceae bacterium]
MDETKVLLEISGSISSIIYQNEENGYTILRLDADDGNQITVLGCIPFAAPGELITVSGLWSHHAAHGMQFKAEFVERTMPETADAIYQYLAGHTVRGIGPATAALMVQRFGAETLNVLEFQPEKLCEIRGISMQKAKEMSTQFRKQVGLRRLIEYLATADIRPVVAARAYQTYGERALELVHENPYILTEDEIGATFSEADTLALLHGFENDSPERVLAAIQFELAYNAHVGHSFIPRGKLIKVTSEMIGVPQELAAERLEELLERQQLVCQQVVNVEACYLARLYEDESYVAERLLSMAQEEYRYEPDYDRIISGIETQLDITFAEQQKQAIELACRHQVVALTGGPGTGKTTSIRAILALFDALKLETCLAAPTGRAAKRMSELTGEEAQTIHRLLEAGISEDGRETVFRKDEDDPLACDAVILDECSMVDISLMSALLRALPADCRLILVGDADQLPSVGPGSVFSGIIRSGVIPSVRLTEIFRQEAGSKIVAYAHAINRGEHPQLTDNKGDFFFLRRKSPEKAAETIVELCSTRLPQKMGIPPEEIQVLTPTRKYATGSIALNAVLQEALNPPSENKREKVFGEKIFREGDRVMQIRNNYDIVLKNIAGLTCGLGVFNGDVGKIVSLDPTTETFTVSYDDKLASYSFEMFNEIEHAWAMTVHKSQGSEYRAVIFAIGKAAPMLQTRSILYTGITRAKKLLIAVGDDDTAHLMIDRERQGRRYCGLRARLCGEYGPIT